MERKIEPMIPDIVVVVLKFSCIWGNRIPNENEIPTDKKRSSEVKLINFTKQDFTFHTDKCILIKSVKEARKQQKDWLISIF